MLTFAQNGIKEASFEAHFPLCGDRRAQHPAYLSPSALSRVAPQRLRNSCSKPAESALSGGGTEATANQALAVGPEYHDQPRPAGAPPAGHELPPGMEFCVLGRSKA
jgi:hypothetical protein